MKRAPIFMAITTLFFAGGTYFLASSGTAEAFSPPLLRTGGSILSEPGARFFPLRSSWGPAPAWHTFLGGSTASAGGVAVARDADGNLYVAGSSDATWGSFGSPINPFAGATDIMVVKFNKYGGLWWNTFLGATAGDAAYGIVLDSAGNIYITGESAATWGSPIRTFQGSDTHPDAFVAKLDTNGALVWNTFLGGTGDDVGRGIALDGSNNVYVIGDSYDGWGSPLNGFAGTSDTFIAKLNTEGTLQWHTFMGSFSWDYGYGIAATWSGDIYVTGVSYGSWGSPIRPYMLDSDAFVAKFDTGGNPKWNTFLGSVDRDEGYRIAIDASENVYVLGGAESTWGSPINPPTPLTGSWSSILVKLNKDGALQWNTFFASGSGHRGETILVEGSGNIFISGASTATWGSPLNPFSGARDICLTKFNGSGALVWNTFLGSSGYDGGSGLVIDPSGNIYFTGYSGSTWGSPIQTFTGNYSAFLARMDTNGALNWNTFFGPVNNDYGYRIAADRDGNILIAGFSSAPWNTGGFPRNPFVGGESDAFVAKLDSQGYRQWHTFLGSSKRDTALGIAADGDGNIYVVGDSGAAWGSPKRNYQGNQDAYLAKLDPGGNLLWNTFLGSSEYDYGGGVALDGQGNVYVVGSSSASWGTPLNPFTGTSNIFVAKLGATGTLLWNTFLGGTGTFNYGTGIAARGPDAVYISGVSGWSSAWGTPLNPPQGGIDVFAAKLNAAGTLLWNTFLGGSQDDYSWGGIALDKNGNVLITGESESGWGTPVIPYTPMWRDAFAAKLDPNGALQWNSFLGSASEDSGYGIAVDDTGAVYVTGRSYATWGSPANPHAGESDAFVAKLTPQGIYLWNTFIGSTKWDEAYGVTLDIRNNIFIVGYGYGTWGTPVTPFAGGLDVFVAKLTNPSQLFLPLILAEGRQEGALLSYLKGSNYQPNPWPK